MSDTILLIEDNEQNRYLATFLLEQRGYVVVQAVDGREGLGLASSLHATMILLDIQLPGMDGYEVARALREIPATSRTPIIAVTSYAMVGDEQRSLEAGCNGYIEKPINAETFVDEIEALHPRMADTEAGS